MSGSVTATVVAGNAATTADEADIRFVTSITDVRRRSNLADYTGQLSVNPTLRITDRYNGPSEVGTGQDVLNYSVTVPCVATASGTIGGTCSGTTTADAIAPGTVRENRRAIWQLGQIRVFDGGADGVVSTQDNTLFAVQGVFVP
jgi:hypothetical protein